MYIHKIYKQDHHHLICVYHTRPRMINCLNRHRLYMHFVQYATEHMRCNAACSTQVKTKTTYLQTTEKTICRFS